MKTIIVDSNFLGHRARFTTGPLRHEGRPTGVVFGFLKQILALGQRFGSNNMVFCWDSRKSLRKKIFRGYKERRRNVSELDRVALDEAFTQFEELRTEILPAIGFRNVFMEEGYEADDLIAQIRFDHTGSAFVIVSADEDLLQLVYSGNVMYNPATDFEWTETAVKERLGIEPWEVPDFKALSGCRSDCVPGIPGVGPKFARMWINNKLPGGKTFDKIRSLKGDGIFNRNMRLVKLPLPGLPILRIVENEFGHIGAYNLWNICEDRGFRTMITNSSCEEWARFFNGDLVERKRRNPPLSRGERHEVRDRIRRRARR